MSVKTNFGRVRVSSDPRDTVKYDSVEENRFRTDVERAFAQIIVPAGGGGGGGGDLTAKYVIGAADGSLTGAIVVPGAFGPDGVPTSPNSMDDEMISATTGYDSAKWTVAYSHGAVWTLNANGGTKLAYTGSAVASIEQPFTFPAGWQFTAKVCMNFTHGSNSSIGMTIRDSATGHLTWFAITGSSSGQKLTAFYFDNDTSYAGSDSITGANEYGGPNEWYYLRVTDASAGKYTFEVSQNGIAWTEIRLVNGASLLPIYPATPDRIGLFGYQTGVGYVRWFRRTV